MALAVLNKNTLCVKYRSGSTDQNDPIYSTMRYSRIKLQATDESILKVGQKIAGILSTDETEVLKEEYYNLKASL